MKCVFCFFAAAFLLVGCGGSGGSIFSGCDDTINSEVLSPDQKWIAAVFTRNCGATTDYSTMVYIRKHGDKFDPSQQGIVFVASGEHPLELAWESPTQLVIKHPRIVVFSKKTSWSKIQLKYESLK